MSKPLPSQELLAAMFSYEPGTGILTRKPLGPSFFGGTSDARRAAWLANSYNAAYAGREAFTHADDKGYRHGKVLGTNYQAHRVIWKLVYGYDPDTIDHRNGHPGDNRLANLRDCSNAENARNYSKPAGGSSKYRGVCWVKRDRRWAARISVGMKKRSLGNYTSEVEAAQAYDRAARDLHGEFAVLNFPDEART